MTPPVLVSHLKKPEWIGDPRMCTHHVDMPELGHAPLDCSAAVIVDRYVADKWNTPFPETTSRRFELVGVPVKSYYRRALIKEPPHDPQANSLRCPSYNDTFTCEPRHVRLQGC